MIESQDLNLRSNQSGIVSITVTVVFVLVISLIVLGFSQVSQRNAEAALDRQLSSQAVYAAEAGINDTLSQVAEFVDTGQPIPEQNNCKSGATHTYTKNNGVVDAKGNIEYTCLLVKSELKDLRYNGLNDVSRVIPVSDKDSNLDEVVLKWSAIPNPGTRRAQDCPDRNDNPTPTTWVDNCQFGLLRVDLVPNTEDVVRSPQSAASKTMTFFAYPRNISPSSAQTHYAYNQSSPTVLYPNPPYSGAPQGVVGYAGCNSQTVCEVRISGLNFKSAYMRVKMLYHETPTFIVSRGTPSETFSYSQVEIDVTGKAQDVLKRLRVRAPIDGSGSKEISDYILEYGLETDRSVCKRFNTSPRLGNDQSPTADRCT